MELELRRETLRFERLVARGEDQVTIEGEATLPGSMRDAVTVLSVQAQVHLGSTQAGNGEAAARGRVCFQVLYTQGDLTRIRALETSCDFTHAMPLEGVTPSMRLCAWASVQDTEGMAASGRMTLRALLSVSMEAFEMTERDLIAEVGGEEKCLQTRMQDVDYCIREKLGEGKTLSREEFDLPRRLGVGDVLSASACAAAGDFSGGNGRIGVSGVIEVRVLHRPDTQGEPLVMTVHEMPYELSIDVQLADGMQPQAAVEVTDVMADSVESEKGRTLRVEAEVRVVLTACSRRQAKLLEDVYSLEGPVLAAKTEEINVHAYETHSDVRESLRMQVMLSGDTPPIGRVLAAFAMPAIASANPAGRRLDVEGVMSVTLIYLPLDSDIPCSLRTHEPFTMTFPLEAQEGVQIQASVLETQAGPATSDRAEIRCMLGLHAVQHGVSRINGVEDIEQLPQEKQTRGFVLVWPATGESRWDTARRLRVPQESLRPAGKGALLAFRK